MHGSMVRPRLMTLALAGALMALTTANVVTAHEGDETGPLSIHLSGRFTDVLYVPYVATQTGADLARVVAAKANVEPEYLALYRSNTALVLSEGEAATLTHRDRDAAYRVDGGTNAERTLQEQEIEAGDALKMLLRPLHGDHIHYAISIFYKGKAVDMTMVEDRAVLAVGSNMTPEEERSEDLCSPGVPGYRQAQPAGADDTQPPYVGPRAWEGDHIDNVYPHFGIHMGKTDWFGMGLMHIHPATAWQWFEQTEGLGANLDALLEQVGIWIWEESSRRYPFHTPLDKTKAGQVVMDFPAGLETLDGTPLVSNYPIETNGSWSHCEYPTNRILVANDEQYVWRLYYWPFSRDPGRYSSLEQNFGRVWLHENMGMISLSYEERQLPSDRIPPQPLPYAVEYLWSNNAYFHLHDSQGRIEDGRVPHDQSGVQMLGFDGEPYPMPNMSRAFCEQYVKESPKQAEGVDCSRLATSTP